MKSVLTLIMSLFVVPSFALAKATATKMEDIEYVCSKGEDFLAFNIKKSRIWLSRGAYIKGAIAPELTKVALSISPLKVVTYSGEMYIGFGDPSNILKISGAILLKKIPVENQVTVKAGTSKHIASMFCIAQ